MKNADHGSAMDEDDFSLLRRPTHLGIAPHQFASFWRAAVAVLFLVMLGISAAGAAAPEEDISFNEAVASLKLGDYVIALEKFTQSAERGNVAAQYDLGWMRARGLGAPTDYPAAYQWFALVARAGQEKGRQALEDISVRMSPAQIAEGEQRARAWQPKPR
jgi:TPR repeat protein